MCVCVCVCVLCVMYVYMCNIYNIGYWILNWIWNTGYGAKS